MSVRNLVLALAIAAVALPALAQVPDVVVTPQEPPTIAAATKPPTSILKPPPPENSRPKPN